jgi:DNA topoisomerase-1
VPDKPKVWASKAKNAQEAHEAIRPTEMSRTPESVKGILSDEQFKLYSLIWRQTMACQMSAAKVERTRVEAEVEEGGRRFTFGASGKTILFPGFLAALTDGAGSLDDRETILPAVRPGQELDPRKVEAQEKHTQPPARYNEASLVRKLEEEGIGRPSTYASILGTIQDRGYIFKKGKELVPTFTAFAVTELLEQGFSDLVDIQFTARMEEELDDIAEGSMDRVAHLSRFYHGSEGGLGINKLVEERGPEIPYPHIEIGSGIVARIGRNGPFLQEGEGEGARRASIPDELPPAELTEAKARELLEAAAKGPEALGRDPETGRAVFLKRGRFGPYLEREALEGEDPRRVSLPPGQNAEDLSDEDLGSLLRFPFELGAHPESGEPIIVALGRYGAYLTCGEKRANVGEWRTGIGLDAAAAAAILAAPPRRGAAASAPKEPIARLGQAEGIDGEIKILDGRYGPYATNGKIHATIPKGTDPKAVTLEQAAELLRAKAAQGPAAKKPTRTRKKR